MSPGPIGIRTNVSDEGRRDILELPDFSSEARSVQVKFMSVSLISIFLSFFELDPNSSFFGIKVTDVNERAMELGFFVVSMSLGMLYFLRIWEERDVISEQFGKILALVDRYKANVEKIKEEHDSFSRAVQDSPLLTGRAEGQIKSATENLRLVINNETTRSKNFGGPKYIEEAQKKFNQRLFAIGQMAVDEAKNSAEKVDENARKFRESLDGWNDALNAFSTSTFVPKELRHFSKRRRFRLITFDIFLPAVVAGLCCLAFFTPNSSNVFSPAVVQTDPSPLLTDEVPTSNPAEKTSPAEEASPTEKP